MALMRRRRPAEGDEAQAQPLGDTDPEATCEIAGTTKEPAPVAGRVLAASAQPTHPASLRRGAGAGCGAQAHDPCALVGDTWKGDHQTGRTPNGCPMAEAPPTPGDVPVTRPRCRPLEDSRTLQARCEAESCAQRLVADSLRGHPPPAARSPRRTCSSPAIVQQGYGIAPINSHSPATPRHDEQFFSVSAAMRSCPVAAM